MKYYTEKSESSSVSSGSTVTHSSSTSSRFSWGSVTTRKDALVSGRSECSVNVWSPSRHHHTNKVVKPRGVVCAFHGIPGHFQSPTDQYLPELLSQCNYIVYGMDFPGYGKSQNEKGSSAKEIVEHGVNLALYAHVKHTTLPLFFTGTGTGGTIALLVSNAIQKLSKSSLRVAGLILLEPLISTHEQTSTLGRLTSKMSSFLPPKPSLTMLCGESHQEYLVEEEYEQKLVSPSIKHLRKANQTTVQLTTMLKKSIHEISRPYICFAAKQEENLRSEGIKDLMSMTSSTDKTLLRYNKDVDNFKVLNDNIVDVACTCSSPGGKSALYNYNASAMRQEYDKLDSSSPTERLKMEDDLIAWLHARTIGVQHFRFVSCLHRSDSEARRKFVIDDLEDAFFS